MPGHRPSQPCTSQCLPVRSGGCAAALCPFPRGWRPRALHPADLPTLAPPRPQFFAPWCGHCQQLKPAWADLARQLKGRVRVGAVDCTQHKQTCDEFQVQGEAPPAPLPPPAPSPQPTTQPQPPMPNPTWDFAAGSCCQLVWHHSAQRRSCCALAGSGAQQPREATPVWMRMPAHAMPGGQREGASLAVDAHACASSLKLRVRHTLPGPPSSAGFPTIKFFGENKDRPEVSCAGQGLSVPFLLLPSLLVLGQRLQLRLLATRVGKSQPRQTGGPARGGSLSLPPGGTIGHEVGRGSCERLHSMLSVPCRPLQPPVPAGAPPAPLQDYNGGRDSASLAAFANERWAAQQPPPEVRARQPGPIPAQPCLLLSVPAGSNCVVPGATPLRQRAAPPPTAGRALQRGVALPFSP